jgi:hypothetical protein
MLSATTLRVSRRYGQRESFDCYGRPFQISISAEKASVHPSRTSGRNGGAVEIIGNFPFMLSRVEAFLGFFSRIISISDPLPNLCGTPV